MCFNGVYVLSTRALYTCRVFITSVLSLYVCWYVNKYICVYSVFIHNT